MPNWCNSNLSVCGPESEVRSIADKLNTKKEDGENGRLADFMPQPTDAAGELIGGVDWQYDNWGTKWGDCETELSDENYAVPTMSSISMHFQTPWGPATGLLKEVSRLHPNVTIDNEYEEPGMNFFGIARYKGGELVIEEHHEYEFDKGVINLSDSWSINFDTDWDDEKQDPHETLNEAIYSAMEHLWSQALLSAPTDSTPIES